MMALCDKYEFDVNYIPESGDFNSEIIVYEILNQRADILESLSSSSTNESVKINYLTEAISYLDLMDKVHLDNLKKTNTLRGSQSKSIIESSIPCYKNALGLLYDLYQLDNSEKYLNDIFSNIQKTKAQNLWLTQLSQKANSIAQVPDSIINKERDLLAQINNIEKSILDAEANGDLELKRNLESNRLFNKKKEYTNFVKKNEEAYPLYFSSKYSFTSLSIQDIQRNISNNELIIDYAFISENEFYAYTIGKSSTPKIFKINSEKNLDLTIRQYNKFIQKTSLRRTHNRNSFVAQSHFLYNHFIKPLNTEMANINKLIIIGDNLTTLYSV